VSELFAPVCSITATKRRRFLWAAWWSGPPARSPFRKPDASSGGARTRDEALAEAEKAAGAKLLEIDGSWARAYARVLRGEPAFPPAGADRGGPKTTKPAAERSIWDVLALSPDATVAEVKRAYRAKALETHPDRGGDDAAFREVQRAYELALERRTKAGARPARAKATRGSR